MTAWYPKEKPLSIYYMRVDLNLFEQLIAKLS